MTKVLRVLLALMSLSLVTGCNGGSSVVNNPKEDIPEIGEDVAILDLETGDLVGSDLSPDLEGPADLVLSDAPPACAPGTGCFGEPCEENGECLSGWCVDHLGASVCSESCQEECPDGWSCEQVSGGGRDLVFICVSSVPSLCLPCWSGADCTGPGDVQVPCVLLEGEGSFCGGACGKDGTCPEGYSCEEVSTTQGVLLEQCVPDAGICACTDKAVGAGLTTPCAIENDLGLCEGVRTCTEDGLSACDAAAPEAEICNDLDDDCDGQVDEDSCDDENPCTDDLCHGVDGCEHVALDGIECPDGDLCTTSDLCVQGVCLGEPKDCDDDNPCTDDWCAPETGLCENVDNVADCDDGDPCTVADECNGGICAGTQVACDCVVDEDCGKLEDGDLCTGTLYCDTATVPYLCKLDPDTVITCPEPSGPNAPCLQPSCDPVTGACGAAEANEGYPCSNGDPCTVADICEKGECLPGVQINCNDGNPCTDDSCEPGVGCLNTPNGDPCEDGDICTVGDYCVQGVCEHGPQINCDDGNVCTDDSCDSSSGCVFTANNVPCDDGNLCTELGECLAGTCIPGKAISCEDGDVCTDDGCEPAVGCVHGFNQSPCDDGNPCTEADLCGGGACSGTLMGCDDMNPCTDDSCDPLSGCVFSPNTASCDDGNACTIADVCGGGSCQPGAPVNCGDGNPCTDDSCHPIDSCLHTPNSDPCDDNNACTQGDVCAEGQCGGGGPVDCDDGNPCTSDSCDWQTGCVNLDNLEPCDDLNECTDGDQCGGGVCLPGAALDCDDGDVCTTDGCVPDLGCVNTDNTAPCDDGDLCTSGDVCSQGECAGLAIVCDDGNPCTDDSCHPLLGCVNTDNTAPCDDLNACTTGDVCSGGVCQGSGSLECDDGNSCTKDLCLPGGGCAHEDVDAACDDGDACTLNDHCEAGACISGGPMDCDDDNPCTDDGCEEGECQNDPNDEACTDGNECTTGDHCEAGVCVYGGNQNCDDGNVCTTDWCDPIQGCQHDDNELLCSDLDACTQGDVCVDGVCVGAGAVDCDDSNPCTDDSCDELSGCVNAANALGCDDGNLCTEGDTCANSVCLPGTALDCDDSNPCTKDLCEPVVGCIHQLATGACDDGDPCTTNDFCNAGACVSGPVMDCNDGNVCTDDACGAGGICQNLPNSAACSDGDACSIGDHCAGGACVTTGILPCDDSNVCTDDSCDPLQGCVHAHNAAPCNDGDPCTTLDVCSAGTCVGSGALSCNDGVACTADSCQPGLGCVYTPITPCCGNGVTEAGESCDDGNTNSGDGCSATCQIESTCGGWQWNGSCWYTGALNQSCNSLCASHCGFDQTGSQHTGNTVGFHFWPGKANGNNWETVECSSTDNNTNWGANGSTPNGNYTHAACHLNCACNC